MKPRVQKLSNRYFSLYLNVINVELSVRGGALDILPEDILYNFKTGQMTDFFEFANYKFC